MSKYFEVLSGLHPFVALNPVSNEQDRICELLWEPERVGSRWTPPIVKVVFDRKDDNGRRIKPTWGDCLNIIGHGSAISERATDALLPFLESAAELLPLTIRPRAFQSYVALHVIASSPGRITSEHVRTGPGTWDVGSVETWHVSGGETTLDLFRIDRGPPHAAYCSKRFMDAVNAHELTGFRFSELIVKVDLQDDGKASMA